ncbi:hypothetical protein, partial [Fischerella thermalis]|uniref:hypothetical protein n=1 Tax=Fischerella thermalis TaxID=372787 RepID=UPI001CA4CB3F
FQRTYAISLRIYSQAGYGVGARCQSWRSPSRRRVARLQGRVPGGWFILHPHLMQRLISFTTSNGS